MTDEIIRKALAALSSINPYDRYSGIETLAHLRCVEAVDELRYMIHDPHPGVRTAAIWALGDIAASQSEDALIGVMLDESSTSATDRIAAIYGIGQISNKKTDALMFDYFAVEMNGDVRDALGRYFLRTREQSLPLLLEILRRNKQRAWLEDGLAAAELIGKLRPPDAVPDLIAIIPHALPALQWEAVRALGEIADPAAEQFLSDWLRDAPPVFGVIIIWALRAIGTPSALATAADWYARYPDAANIPLDDLPHVPPPRPDDIS